MLFLQFHYEHLPKAGPHFDDGDNNTQVMRQVVDMKVPIRQTDCTNLFLVGKPSDLMYGSSIRNLLCTFAATNQSSDDLLWNSRGTCHSITYFTADIGFQCVWINKGNMLANVSLVIEYTITFAHTVAAYPAWQWVKFGYRVCMTILVCHLMWIKYYCHCLQLESLLLKLGHRTDTPKGNWYNEVVWGDPTPIILNKPLRCFGFIPR
ncbi:hypothetical protein THRCLA_21953, partial [Thraustotheca clavata]